MLVLQIRLTLAENLFSLLAEISIFLSSEGNICPIVRIKQMVVIVYLSNNIAHSCLNYYFKASSTLNKFNFVPCSNLHDVLLKIKVTG